MRFAALLAALLASLLSTTALAHEGPRVWIGNVGGAVTTYTSDNDLGPTSYAPSRLFPGQLTETSLNRWTTEFPGYEVKTIAGNVRPDTVFGFNIPGPLLAYDGAAKRFRPTADLFPAPAPQMQVSLGAPARRTGTGPADGFDFFTFGELGDHEHLLYSLLGNGSSISNGPDAIYALPLRLTGKPPDSLAPPGTSETYYLVLGKNVASSSDTFQEAMTVAGQTLVPEPAGGAIFLAAVGWGLCRRRVIR